MIEREMGKHLSSRITSELIAGEGFSMLSKGLPDLAQALETSLLASY
jgi:hypothetical protein